jgi:hypothetical protein
MVAFINSTFDVMEIGIFRIFKVVVGDVVAGAVVTFPVNAFPLTVVATGGVVTFPLTVVATGDVVTFPLIVVVPGVVVSNPSLKLLLNGINETTHTAIINNPRIKISLVFIC